MGQLKSSRDATGWQFRILPPIEASSMSESSLDTIRLQHCVERWQAGERAAAQELLEAVGQRLEHLARKMLRGFPNVRNWTETGDVLQGSLLRLLHSLQNVRPASTRA